MLDVVVVGGGPSGLACALWLGRYNRTVVVYDTGEPRNRPAWAVHGYPGIPDPPPLELRARIREQAIEAGARHVIAAVASIAGEKDAFSIVFENGSSVRSRRVVLAYGLRDFVPDVPGIAEFYGHSIYHCPDCDGPSVSGERVAVLGNNRHAAALALYMLTWSDDVLMLTNGDAPRLRDDVATTLRAQRIRVVTDRIDCLEGVNGKLSGALMSNGTTLPIGALFFHLGSEPRCNFASQLGCDVDEEGYLAVDRGHQTSVPGLYATGDIAGHPHLAVTAAADGIRAALAIHRSLQPEEFFVGA